MEDIAVLIEAPTLDAALDKAALVLDCATDEVAWITVSGDSEPKAAAIRIAAFSLAKPPEGPGLTPWGREAASFSDDGIAREPMPMQPPRKIDGDIVVEMGKIHHYGDLIINGGILRGAQVSARGRIMVYGDVLDSAAIVAGESITIKGGLLGSAISVRGDIACRYAQGANIRGRDIAVLENFVQSHLIAQRTVDIGGALQGGSAASGGNLQVGVAGAPKAAYQTRIRSGGTYRLRILAQTARERLTRIESRLLDAGVEVAVLNRLADIYRSNQERLLKALEGTPSDVSVRIHDRIYPKVSVEIDEARYDVSTEMPSATFWKDRQTGILKVTTHE